MSVLTMAMSGGPCGNPARCSGTRLHPLLTTSCEFDPMAKSVDCASNACTVSVTRYFAAGAGSGRKRNVDPVAPSGFCGVMSMLRTGPSSTPSMTCSRVMRDATTSPLGTTVTWMSADCAQSPPHPAATHAVSATTKNRSIFAEDTPARRPSHLGGRPPMPPAVRRSPRIA